MSFTDTLPKPERPGCLLDFAGIRAVLPHRYPFLYIDRVLSQEGEKITCQKNVTFNEPFFVGHFPDEPVMPGVIQVEAMAQAMCILMSLAHPEDMAGKRPAFMGVDQCRFRKPVRPGDVLIIEAEIVKYRRGIGSVECRTFRDGELVSEAVLMATMV
jgi:beta-hydroxyacyl-ACP dehydratase FabZ